MELTPIHDSVVRKYCRAIVHMRQQIREKRFGLVLGAGSSLDLGFPSWTELVNRIGAHPEVNAAELLGRLGGNTSRSQLLFQYFRASRLKEATSADFKYNKAELQVEADWRRIVHDCLYREVPKDSDELLSKDRYLKKFLPVVRETRLTINYNFDDSVQRMLAATRTEQDRSRTRGYTTVWSPDVQMYPRDGVIYHPNGFLPQDLRERPSEHLVFLDDTFADQLIESTHGHYGSLAYHLAQSTRLFIGLSLEDSTLRHLLRQHAHVYPGHFHYYVAHVADAGGLKDDIYTAAVADANFRTYNLITLFLTTDEIAALGDLLSLDDHEFRALAEENGEAVKYRFLVTGAVSVGKSTTVSHFHSLRTLDEWLEARAPGMEKAPEKLPDTEVTEIDLWVARQVGLKNLNLLNAPDGIVIVDRAPLDAFAFTPREGWSNKATLLLSGISPRQSRRALCSAHIILLIGDPGVMAVRSIARHKEMDMEHLKEQQELLEEVYTLEQGVSVIYTIDKSVEQVVKEVADVVYRKQPYVEMPLQQVLLDFQVNGYEVCIERKASKTEN